MRGREIVLRYLDDFLSKERESHATVQRPAPAAPIALSWILYKPVDLSVAINHVQENAQSQFIINRMFVPTIDDHPFNWAMIVKDGFTLNEGASIVVRDSERMHIYALEKQEDRDACIQYARSKTKLIDLRLGINADFSDINTIERAEKSMDLSINRTIAAKRALVQAFRDCQCGECIKMTPKRTENVLPFRVNQTPFNF